jgi:hypothetical protein
MSVDLPAPEEPSRATVRRSLKYASSPPTPLPLKADTAWTGAPGAAATAYSHAA